MIFRSLKYFQRIEKGKGTKGQRERQNGHAQIAVAYPAAADCGRKDSGSKFLQQHPTSIHFVKSAGRPQPLTINIVHVLVRCRMIVLFIKFNAATVDSECAVGLGIPSSFTKPS